MGLNSTDFDLIQCQYLNVHQKNYNFFIIKSKIDIKTVDELQKIANIINCEIEHKEILSDKLKSYRVKNLRPIEFCFSGYDYFIKEKLGKKVLDFDFANYSKNKNEFINKHPELKNCVNYLFEHNLKLIADFFLTDVEKIKQGKLNIRIGMQKRLMFNINNK
jgi:hypothetical protein